MTLAWGAIPARRRHLYFYILLILVSLAANAIKSGWLSTTLSAVQVPRQQEIARLVEIRAIALGLY
jgi:hypothetical protein